MLRIVDTPAPGALPGAPGRPPAAMERYTLASRGAVLFGTIFYGIVVAAFVVLPLLSWAHLVPISGEYGFRPFMLLFLLVGLVPLALVARLVAVRSAGARRGKWC